MGSINLLLRLAHHKLPLLLTESGAKKVIAVSVCKTIGNALHGMRTFLIKDTYPKRNVCILARYSSGVKQKIANFEKRYEGIPAVLRRFCPNGRIFQGYILKYHIGNGRKMCYNGFVGIPWGAEQGFFGENKYIGYPA